VQPVEESPANDCVKKPAVLSPPLASSPDLRQARRSGVSAVAVEAFMNNVGWVLTSCIL
jgi:hypothetical protein